MSYIPENQEKMDNYLDRLNAGASALRQIDTLKDSIKDLADSVKEEFDIKPADFKKFLSVYYKENLSEIREEVDALEEAFHQVKGDVGEY